MATALNDSDDFESRYSDSLENKFWAALNFAIEDTLPCPASDGKLPYGFENTNASPVHPLSNGNLCYSVAASRCKNGSNHGEFERIRSAPHGTKKNELSLRVEVPDNRIAIPGTHSPTTAVRTSALSPFSSQAQWQLPARGRIQPSTPVLNLVSNFLDSMITESKSRSSTPVAAITSNPREDTLIVESEVLIQFVEDINQSAPQSPHEEDTTAGSSHLGVSREDSFMRLQIPPSPIAVPAKAGFDIPSAFVANGPAGCAQELDALWRMRWDRLFARDAYY